MANNLANCVTKFTTRLDKVIEQQTKTSDLNINGDLLGEFVGAGQIQIAKIAMSGLGDYSRETGFPEGSATTDWETMTLKHDRGREFTIDIMDDEERAKIVSAHVMSEFARTKVVPEVDAIRFARLCENAGAKENEALTTPEQCLDAVLTAEEVIEDTGVPLSECVLYLTSRVKTSLRKAQPWRMGQGESPNTRFDTFDDMKVVTVPSARFLSALELFDGRAESEYEGGFKAAAGAASINYMIVHPSAGQAISKHETLRYFSPEVNQKANGHLWQYRLYHDMLVYEHRKDLIYASLATA